MQEFVIFLRSRDGARSPTAEEISIHCQRLNALAQEGGLIAAGPFRDGAGDGLILARFPDLTRAQLFADDDPFVQGGMKTAEIRPWSWGRPENGQLGVLAPRPGSFPGFLETLHLRATVREFEDRPIPKPLLAAVLAAATRAPSDFNIQPWRPVVVTSAEDRQKLQSCCYNQSHVGRAAADVICCVDSSTFHGHAPRVVEERIALGSLKPEQREKHIASVLNFFPETAIPAVRNGVIFGQQLLLAALSQGIAGAWTGGFKADLVRREFGIPSDISIVGIVALGWPKGLHSPMPKLAPEETVSWGRWGARPE